MYANCGHLNGVRQLGSDSNSNFHPFSSSVHWLVGRENNKTENCQPGQDYKKDSPCYSSRTHYGKPGRTELFLWTSKAV